MKRLLKHTSLGDKIFIIFNYSFIGLFSLLCIFPFLYVLSYSVMPYADYLKDPINLIPYNITFSSYSKVLQFPLIYSGYKLSVFITIVGTFLNVFLLSISAYPLSKKDLKGRNFVMKLILFTMFFSGGIIPSYILVRGLGILNTPWALILPGAISAYNLILMKNFMNSIPDSLEESAIIDGANELVVLFKIILPLSMPAIATFTLFHAVAHWNAFFTAILYMSKRSMWPIMLVLRELVIEDGTSQVATGVAAVESNPFTLKMAAIIIAVLPILLVYPFLQKYFMKGMLLGSVKG